jgi:hypothetical protein
VIAPLLWAEKDGSEYAGLFLLFMAAIPFSIVAGLAGCVFSLDRSLPRRVSGFLFALNAGSLWFGFYLVAMFLNSD